MVAYALSHVLFSAQTHTKDCTLPEWTTPKLVNISYFAHVTYRFSSREQLQELSVGTNT